MGCPTSEFIFLFYKTYYKEKHILSFRVIWNYSQTSIKRSSLGQRKSDLIRQVTSLMKFNSYFLWYDQNMVTFWYRWLLNAVWAGFTNLYKLWIACGNILLWCRFYIIIISLNRRGSRDRMVVRFTTTCAISVSITTKLVSWNPFHGEVYPIQHYVIKFVSDFRQVGGFHRVLQFPPPIKLTATI